jgi:transposase InsO family protein
MTIVALLGLFFFISKDEIFKQFINFYYRVENEKFSKINTIRSDHGKEFENTKFDDFYNKRGYRHEYSAPHTPQQNGVVERKKSNIARTYSNHAS